MKAKHSGLIAVLALTLLSTGCSKNTVVTQQQEPTEISFSWWGNDVRHDYTIEAVKDFEKLHPEIKVKCHYAEWSGYQTRNHVQMISNTECDIMQINYAWLQQYSPDGTGYYDINQVADYIDLTNFSKEDLSYGMRNGKLNALPIALNTQTVYINQTIYEQYGLPVPRSWDDFMQAGKTMQGNHYPLSMSKKSLWFYAVAYAGQKTGKEFMDEDGNILFQKEDLQLMLEFYTELVGNKIIPQVELFDKLELKTGHYAGVLAWLSDANSYCKDAIANGYNIEIADYTTSDALKNWYIKPATMYAMRKDIEHPKEAALFLNYLLNSSEMAEHQQIEKGIPLSSSARAYLEEHDLLSGIQYDAFRKMTEQKEELTLISPHFENESLVERFVTACNEVLYGKSSAEEQAAILYQDLRKK